MRVFLSILLSTLFAGVSPLTQAQQDTAPVPSVESFKNLVLTFCRTGFYNREKVRCYTREFLEQRGNDLVFLTQYDGSRKKVEITLSEHHSMKIRGNGGTFKPDSGMFQFPLHVGKTWKRDYEQEVGGSVRMRTRHAEVVKFEEIHIKAGTFKAFQISAFNQLSTARTPATEKYFYCPEIASVCLYESREFDIYEEVTQVTKKTP